MVDEAMAAVRAESATRWAALKAATERDREAERNRVRFTADEMKGARAVRDKNGWHAVVRVNGKSVTVETPWSWTERIAVESVLEYRT
jgi:hypothetical protein